MEYLGGSILETAEIFVTKNYREIILMLQSDIKSTSAIYIMILINNRRGLSPRDPDFFSL